MKKVLFVATVVQKHINVFHIPFLKLFKEKGYKTYVASSNDTGRSDVSIPYCDEYFEIAFKRNPLHPGNISAYRKLKAIINSNDFDIIHCHTPVGGLIGRLAALSARKKGTRVFYTAHGFHFYKGAPLKNWLFYYPVEKFCSYFTDVLITINQEDFTLAKKRMKANRTEYVPGVGVNIQKFSDIQIDKSSKRIEIGIPKNAFVLFSVGELNENKNHQVIIKAIAKLNDKNIHYVIAGEGDKRGYLNALASELGISEQLHLLGYRKDIAQLNHAADIFCFPSIREGLPIALIEAMACGLPIVAANNRGTNEVIVCDKNGFLCKYNDDGAFALSISKLMKEDNLYNCFSDAARVSIKKFDVENIVNIMKEVYE